jgi:hypothetical protein
LSGQPPVDWQTARENPDCRKWHDLTLNLLNRHGAQRIRDSILWHQPSISYTVCLNMPNRPTSDMPASIGREKPAADIAFRGARQTPFENTP